MATYVIARNGGCEGHSPPVLVISNREAAFMALALYRSIGVSGFELFEVPEWPEVGTVWWDTKPIEKESA